MSLMLTLLMQIHAAGAILPKCPRIEIKRTRTNHARLWMGFPQGISPACLPELTVLTDSLDLTANPFGRAGVITAITIVSNSEQD